MDCQKTECEEINWHDILLEIIIIVYDDIGSPKPLWRSNIIIDELAMPHQILRGQSNMEKLW
jgi:hypothetical protein